MAPGDAACVGRTGMLAIAAGTAVGVAAAASDFAPSQVAISAALCVFLVLNNFVDDNAGGLAVAYACCCLGFFLGFGAAAAGRSVAEGGGDVWAALPMPLFILLVMLFHAAEFAFVFFFHTKDMNFRALMFAPVPAGGYSIALIAAVTEYWSKIAMFGEAPVSLRVVRNAVVAIGFIGGILGWAIRVAALFTAQSNFTHLVAYRKEPGHVLVTWGVYRFCRHPGYVGWFLWSVSTQLVLFNPLCFAAYAYVSWRFFAGRIPGEEEYLIDFFGEEYYFYARRVPCGIPWISSLTP